MPNRDAKAATPVEIIAHRGYSARAPENTLVAVEAAIAAGADAVEFDLHVTADGVPVLFHDSTLDRTTDGVGPLRAVPFDRIRRLDAGSWFGAPFAGEPVPSFDEALACIGDRVRRVYPEVKGYRDEGDLHRMVELVLQRGMGDRTVFISMDWQALDRMRERHRDLRIGYVVEKVARAPEALDRATGDPLSLLDFRASIVLDDPTLARKAQSNGVDLAAWTVDDPAEATRVLAAGVRRITTNRVAELLAWSATL